LGIRVISGSKGKAREEMGEMGERGYGIHALLVKNWCWGEKHIVLEWSGDIE